MQEYFWVRWNKLVRHPEELEVRKWFTWEPNPDGEVTIMRHRWGKYDDGTFDYWETIASDQDIGREEFTILERIPERRFNAGDNP